VGQVWPYPHFTEVALESQAPMRRHRPFAWGIVSAYFPKKMGLREGFRAVFRFSLKIRRKYPLDVSPPSTGATFFGRPTFAMTFFRCWGKSW
jgi:hypothetical protein